MALSHLGEVSEVSNVYWTNRQWHLRVWLAKVDDDIELARRLQALIAECVRRGKAQPLKVVAGKEVAR